MEDLFDEKLLEASRLAEALQDGQSEEKESEGKKTEVKQETENSRPVSRTEEPVAAPVPQTGEEAVDQLIKEIVQETQEEIAAEGIQTEDIRKEFFQKKAEKANLLSSNCWKNVPSLLSDGLKTTERQCPAISTSIRASCMK